MKRGFTAAVAMALATLASGCGGGAPSVSDGWVRLAANPGAPAAAYFVLHGGGGDDALTGVATDMAAGAQPHRSTDMGAGGRVMTTMAPLPRLDLPAGASVPFAPGGLHVMLTGVNPGVKPGGDLVMTFTFAKGPPVTDRLKVVGPGDPSPY